MNTQLSERREMKQRIARQIALVEELEREGLEALAKVALNILIGLQKTEELMEPQSYRRIKKHPARAHHEPQVPMG